MFEGFEIRDIPTSATTIRLRIGGSGPPLLLLHGYPQSHVLWHRVAPALAARCTVVAADLRGYGDSGKPPADPEHAAYGKRASARDMVEAMAALGHERFMLAGHDRGGRVAHRLALDHPERLERLAVLDIVPTRTVFRRDQSGDRDRLLSLVLPDPALRSARAADRRRSRSTTCTRSSAAGAAASRRSPRRRWPSTSAAFATRRRSMPPARTTGPRPRSIWPTTRPISSGRSSARCSRSGAGAA